LVYCIDGGNLSIISARKEHHGRWQCVVSNAVGDIISDVMITVKRKKWQQLLFPYSGFRNQKRSNQAQGYFNGLYPHQQYSTVCLDSKQICSAYNGVCALLFFD